MKNSFILFSVLVTFLFFATGCKFFQKEEAPPPEEETTVEEEEEEDEEEAAEEEEAKEAEEEGEETLVEKEDIEKAAKIFNMLHNDDLKEKAKMKQFAKFLDEFEWDLEMFQAMIFDIARDAASTTIYKELQEDKE